MQKSKQKAFTLIELLVVIAIIGLLASIVLVALNGARQKSRVATRAADLREVQTALELYYNDNGGYPNPGWGWRSQCSAWGGFPANQVISPNFIPTYMSNFPIDPMMNASSNQNCFLYLSNGTDYKFMDYNLTDMTLTQIHSNPALVDPCRNDVQSCGWSDSSLSWSVQSSTNANW